MYADTSKNLTQPRMLSTTDEDVVAADYFTCVVMLVCKMQTVHDIAVIAYFSKLVECTCILNADGPEFSTVRRYGREDVRVLPDDLGSADTDWYSYCRRTTSPQQLN